MQRSETHEVQFPTMMLRCASFNGELQAQAYRDNDACGLPLNDYDDSPPENLVSYSPDRLPPMRSGPVPALFS